MAKRTLKGGALVCPLPPTMVSCGDMENSNIITIGWTGILNTIPPKTYISVRPTRHSYEILKERVSLLSISHHQILLKRQIIAEFTPAKR